MNKISAINKSALQIQCNGVDLMRSRLLKIAMAFIGQTTKKESELKNSFIEVLLELF